MKNYWANFPKERFYIICVECSKEFFVHKCRRHTARFCSNSCKGYWVGKLRREKAKPRISTQGYYFIINHEFHRANKQGYAKIADIVIEEKIGRSLKKGEVVHHMNGDKLDDSPDNLEVMYKKEHDRMHTKRRWENNNIHPFR